MTKFSISNKIYDSKADFIEALYKEYSDYISLINSLQSKDPASLAAAYWLRWYWVKACGELWAASNKTDSNVFYCILLL